MLGSILAVLAEGRGGAVPCPFPSVMGFGPCPCGCDVQPYAYTGTDKKVYANRSCFEKENVKAKWDTVASANYLCPCGCLRLRQSKYKGKDGLKYANKQCLENANMEWDREKSSKAKPCAGCGKGEGHIRAANKLWNCNFACLGKSGQEPDLTEGAKCYLEGCNKRHQGYCTATDGSKYCTLPHLFEDGKDWVRPAYYTCARPGCGKGSATRRVSTTGEAFCGFQCMQLVDAELHPRLQTARDALFEPVVRMLAAKDWDVRKKPYSEELAALNEKIDAAMEIARVLGDDGWASIQLTAAHRSAAEHRSLLSRDYIKARPDFSQIKAMRDHAIVLVVAETDYGPRAATLEAAAQQHFRAQEGPVAKARRLFGDSTPGGPSCPLPGFPYEVTFGLVPAKRPTSEQLVKVREIMAKHGLRDAVDRDTLTGATSKIYEILRKVDDEVLVELRKIYKNTVGRGLKRRFAQLIVAEQERRRSGRSAATIEVSDEEEDLADFFENEDAEDAENAPINAASSGGPAGPAIAPPALPTSAPPKPAPSCAAVAATPAPTTPSPAPTTAAPATSPPRKRPRNSIGSENAQKPKGGGLKQQILNFGPRK